MQGTGGGGERKDVGAVPASLSRRVTLPRGEVGRQPASPLRGNGAPFVLKGFQGRQAKGGHRVGRLLAEFIVGGARQVL